MRAHAGNGKLINAGAADVLGLANRFVRKHRAGAQGEPSPVCAQQASTRRPDVYGLNRFLQLLGGAECHLLAGLDFDLLTGGGIAAHARGALAHLQDA
jgi:hypothetical protein